MSKPDSPLFAVSSATKNQKRCFGSARHPANDCCKTGADGPLPCIDAPAVAVELPLSRVVLSNSGLAQFTHSGPIAGGSTVDLVVRLDQVDDILKSLTVFDRQGAIGAVSLPGKAPLAELFRDLPFGPEALDSPKALLNALVGSEIEIAGPVNAKGRVFRVEDEETKLPNDGGTTTRHRLTLMTGRGLVQAILEDVTTLSFADPQAKAQIERALGGLTENRAKDRRRLAIGFLGEGNRNVAISYVVPPRSGRPPTGSCCRMTAAMRASRVGRWWKI